MYHFSVNKKCEKALFLHHNQKQHKEKHWIKYLKEMEGCLK